MNDDEKSELFKEIIKDQIMMGQTGKEIHSNESSRLVRLSAAQTVRKDETLRSQSPLEKSAEVFKIRQYLPHEVS